MTGYILKTYPDRVEIASDGAIYDLDGVVLGSRYKVRVADDLPLAVMGSGGTQAIEIISDLIMLAARVTSSVDETLSLLAGSLEQCAQAASEDYPLRIVIAAISETRGPTTLLFTMIGADGDMPAFQLQEKPNGFGMGALPGGGELLAMGLKGQTLEDDAPPLFEYMRRAKLPTPGDPDREPGYKIGGHLDLTVVRPDGVTTKRLRTWPDVIGEKIDPFKEDAAAA